MSVWELFSGKLSALSEGNATARAHRDAESLLGTRLPEEAEKDGYKYVSRMADAFPPEAMAIEFVNSYGRFIGRQFNDFSDSEKNLVQNQFSKAANEIATMQASGASIDHLTLVPFLNHCAQFGVETGQIKRTWNV